MMIFTELIKETKFWKATDNTYICVLVLKNGYEVVGSHTFYDGEGTEQLGKMSAEGDATLKLAELENYVDFYTKE